VAAGDWSDETITIWLCDISIGFMRLFRENIICRKSAILRVAEFPALLLCGE